MTHLRPTHPETGGTKTYAEYSDDELAHALTQEAANPSGDRGLAEELARRQVSKDEPPARTKDEAEAQRLALEDAVVAKAAELLAEAEAKAAEAKAAEAKAAEATEPTKS